MSEYEDNVQLETRSNPLGSNIDLPGQLVEIIDSLEPLTASVVDLLSLVSDPAAEVRTAAEVVRQDVVLSMRVLKEANSAASAPVNEIQTVEQAVGRLGLARTAAIACGLAVCSEAARPLITYRLAAGELWERSVTASYLAEAILGLAGGKAGPAVVVGALLQDIGQVILDQILDAQLVGRLAPWLPIEAIERQLVDFDHAQVGAEVLRQWSLPEAVVECVRLHHEPLYIADDPATIVCLSSLMAHQLHAQESDITPPFGTNFHTLVAALELDSQAVIERSHHLLEQAGRAESDQLEGLAIQL